jgi:hypothetical protein
MMQTPLDEGFFNFEALEGVKIGCQADVKSESLSIDWTRCGSPPMTPGKSTWPSLLKPCLGRCATLHSTDVLTGYSVHSPALAYDQHKRASVGDGVPLPFSLTIAISSISAL